MTLRHWLDRLTIAARSACCDFAPVEIADLTAAIREGFGPGPDASSDLRVQALERRIKRAEGGSGGLCPWCHAWVAHGGHTTECEAFHVDGALR